jgi:hypothetical protein
VNVPLSFFISFFFIDLRARKEGQCYRAILFIASVLGGPCLHCRHVMSGFLIFALLRLCLCLSPPVCAFIHVLVLPGQGSWLTAPCLTII